MDILKRKCDEDIELLQAEIDALKKEIEVLRQFGNKDCTAMADEYLDKGE